MNVASIGLGDIAQKAYLPITTQINGINPYFCTRTESTLQHLAKKYRVQNLYRSVDELPKKDLDAAFVHAASGAHYSIVKKLLEAKIPTFVDKPITYELKKTEELLALAEKNKTILMTGFNRRYVPTYRSLLEIGDPKTIIMQKNRTYQPGDPREFIMDDFIHVIDTISYLMGEVDINSLDANKIMRDDKLIQVSLSLKNGNNKAVGIMNRDNAITEETLEVMTFKQKRKVKDITQTIEYNDGGEKIKQAAGWNKMNYNRGFVDMINEFLRRVKNNENDQKELKADLLTHRLAEKVLKI